MGEFEDRVQYLPVSREHLLRDRGEKCWHSDHTEPLHPEDEASGWQSPVWRKREACYADLSFYAPHELNITRSPLQILKQERTQREEGKVVDMENGETVGQWEGSEQCQRLRSPRACAHVIESELRKEWNKKTFPLLYGKLRNRV